MTRVRRPRPARPLAVDDRTAWKTRRYERTRRRVVAGALTPPAVYRTWSWVSTGRACDGCGEIVGAAEIEHDVRRGRRDRPAAPRRVLQRLLRARVERRFALIERRGVGIRAQRQRGEHGIGNALRTNRLGDERIEPGVEDLVAPRHRGQRDDGNVVQAARCP
jgi:hypothetical protein